MKTPITRGLSAGTLLGLSISKQGKMDPDERAKLMKHYYATRKERGQVKSMWVIDPRKSKFIGRWDLAAGLALMFTAIVTPYEVGFLQPVPADERMSDALFLCNRVIDIVFVIDMILQYFVAYQVSDPRRGTMWVLDLRSIALQYTFSRWFVLDLFSISTAAFDIFDSGGSSNLFMLRALRALRLIKLVRLARGSRMLLRWEKRLSINYAYLGLLQSLCAILVSCHWFACIWGLQSSFDRLGTWVGASEYCMPLPLDGSSLLRAEADALLETCPPDKSCGFRECQHGVCSEGTMCEPPLSMYVYAIYFATTTITSVGYGDIHATAFNVTEQLITTLMILAGGMIWANLVGTFCGLAAQLDPDLRERRERLSILNSFMTDTGLPPFLRYRLREYLFESAAVFKAGRARELLDQVSPALQGEVALTVSTHRLEYVWYLQAAPTVLKIELASQLRPLLLPQGEQAPPGFLYILERGTAIWCARVLRAPAVWGADILLQNEGLQLSFAALAMSYSFVWVLDAESLAKTFAEFPHATQPLERIRRRWACRRVIVRAAERAVLAQGKQFHGRLRPIYGHRSQYSAGLERSTRFSDVDEWWDVDNPVLTEADEDAPPSEEKTRRRLVKLSNAAPTLKQAGAAKLGSLLLRLAPKQLAGEGGRRAMAQKKLELEQSFRMESVRKDIEQAARLFGAQKLRRSRLTDKLGETDARAKLILDVDNLSKGQQQLNAAVAEMAADLRTVMKAMALKKDEGTPSHTAGGAKGAQKRTQTLTA